jgi:hypothetical protein
MTTVWPIVALGMVAAISLLLPAAVNRFKRLRGGSAATASPAVVTLTDNAMRWPAVFVVTTTPPALMLLFLYAATAQQPDPPSLWFLPVIILPVAVGALYARRKLHHDGNAGDCE